jgi:hypothetical protein
MSTTSANCEHQYHIITDFDYIGFPTFNQGFVLYKNTLYTIDTTQFTDLREFCDNYFVLHLYKTHLRASSNKAIDLPLNVCCENIIEITYMYLCDEPSFGKFIYVSSIENEFAPYIIYGIDGNLEPYNGNSQVSVDSIPTFCCEATSGEILLINLHGKVIKTIKNVCIDMNNKYKFKIGNNYLFAKNYGDLNCWEYINTALNTKPAAASACCFDE